MDGVCGDKRRRLSDATELRYKTEVLYIITLFGTSLMLFSMPYYRLVVYPRSLSQPG